jgi:hypothetical protein
LNHPSALLAQFGQLGLMLIIGLYGGTLPAFLVEAAPELHEEGIEFHPLPVLPDEWN